METKDKALHEIKAIGAAALFFGVWIAGLVTLKELVLEEYSIRFSGFSVVLIGALVLSKVVLVLEHVPLPWVRTRSAWVEVLARTLLYTFGTFVVIVLEKAIETRHDYGGVVAAVPWVIRHADEHHVWVNSLCMAAAFIAWNALAVVRLHLGEGGLRRLFLSPMSTTAK